MVPLLQAIPDVVMIGVDGKQLTPEQVKELKEKQAAGKATEAEAGIAEEAETGRTEETVENPPAMTEEHEKPEPEMPSEEMSNPN